MKKLSLTLLAAALGLAALPATSHARFVFTLTESGPNVVVNGSGTLNTTALTRQNGGSSGGFFRGGGQSTGLLYVGPAGSNTNFDFYSGGGLSGPKIFGPGTTNIAASSGTGDFVGIFAAGINLFLPPNYVSSTLLTDSATFTNYTFATLGFTPGTYTYTWGTGLNADSLTIIGAASVVPEPSTWAFVAAGAGLLGFATLRRRAAVRA